MAVVESVTRVRVGSGVRLEWLACHPRLPLIAGLESGRPAVHVWECGERELRELGTVGQDSAAYGDAPSWELRKRVPAVAWHPEEPLLLVAREGAAVRWTPAGLCEVDWLAPAAAYRHLAFSLDGQTLWASPSASTSSQPGQYHCDVIDLTSGIAGTGPGWDTGVAVHPGGGLVATLQSDQGATHVLFARVDHEGTPTVMRVLRRALILDVDGYGTPVFSADGRHLAVRGNAYGNTLEVFEFPSLNRVLATTLGEPNPGGYPPSKEWLGQMRAWSRDNIAFGVQPGVLWIGTPTGTLVEVDLDSQLTVGHEVLAGSPVTALCATTAGDLVVGTGEGDLVLASVLTGSANSHAVDADAARGRVAAFLDATSEVPEDGDLETHLVVTDGERTWEPDALKTVTTAAETDPTWLRLRAAVNNVFGQQG